LDVGDVEEEEEEEEGGAEWTSPVGPPME